MEFLLSWFLGPAGPNTNFYLESSVLFWLTGWLLVVVVSWYNFTITKQDSLFCSAQSDHHCIDLFIIRPVADVVGGGDGSGHVSGGTLS